MRVSLTHLLWLSCFGAANLAVACTGTVEELGGFEQQQSPASVANGQEGDGLRQPSSGSTGSEPSDEPAEQNGGGNNGNQATNGSAGDDSANTAAGDDDGSPSAADDAGAEPNTPIEDAGAPIDPEAASIERGAGIYPALCAGCHGQNGQGGRVGVSLDEARSFESLANRIDGSMPEGNPGACNTACAEDLARFILATFVN